ncbi:aminopeptidase N [Parenemella sanctibonifatiensis]|uniref:Aminopeptidase N n=1 Tax=Parenemella sanctibonifatiensis TaxID=2016505 RepID=A0A255EKU3_9ACTN|nr:aminopeptidase N [Parenemella sanctibonifatiensis]OYN88753.1 aminopeptidase N [Parenemella sanctibonifatiensis]
MNPSNVTREKARQRSDAVELNEYAVELDLSQAADPAQTHFPTTSWLQLVTSEPTVEIDFIGGDGGGLTGVSVDGELHERHYDGARLTLHDIPVGRPVVIEIRGRAAYSRTGQGLHRFVDPTDGETYLYTHFEPADARRMYANLEQPDLKAPFRLSVIAPSRWQVTSNQAAEATIDLGDETRHEFGTTPELSTYLTALAAGPYHHVHRTWQRAATTGTDEAADDLSIEVGLWCRQSLAEHLDPEELFEITFAGLDFFHDNFGYPYPWGKYDQVFVPEYNIGAMENPGCVTFTERYIFSSPATQAQRQGRANTILHEMAHMWFGDLVTPQWWDDLWLKESFADYMGTHASAEATRFTDAWVPFAGGRKLWAYVQDSLPTTHPIVADIPDLDAARQNFDGITYAKGASVLKQLVRFVGTEEFFAGARDYFQRYAFGSTTLPDLLDSLSRASGRDLSQWATRWLETAGPDVLTPVVTEAASVQRSGTIEELVIEQQSVDPTTGAWVGRPHRLQVGLYRSGADGLVRTELIETELAAGEPTEGVRRHPVAEATGLPVPDLVLVNDDDWTYALVRLDDRGRETVLAQLSRLGDPMARAVIWSSLWTAVREAELPAARFVQAVAEHAPAETDISLLTTITRNAGTAVRRYVPAGRRSEVADGLYAAAQAQIAAAQPGSDGWLVWHRVAGALLPLLTELPADAVTQVPAEGGDDLRWLYWSGLAAAGVATPEQLEAELARKDTFDNRVNHLGALSARPTPEVKADVWQRVHQPGAYSNDEVDAMIGGFNAPAHSGLVARYAVDYIQGLEQTWADHPMEIAERLAAGLFPRPDHESGTDPADHPVVGATREWLELHPDAPGALRRIVTEETAELQRALTAQAAGE